jgi:hypothetical protein
MPFHSPISSKFKSFLPIRELLQERSLAEGEILKVTAAVLDRSLPEERSKVSVFGTQAPVEYRRCTTTHQDSLYR